MLVQNYIGVFPTVMVYSDLSAGSRTIRPMPRRDQDLNAASVLSHLGVMLAVSALAGLLVAGLALPFIAVAGAGASNVAQSLEDLPEDLIAEPLAQRTKVLDSEGKRIATWYDQNRVNVR